MFVGHPAKQRAATQSSVTADCSKNAAAWRSAALLIPCDDSRCRFRQLKLITYSFQTSGENFDFVCRCASAVFSSTIVPCCFSTLRCPLIAAMPRNRRAWCRIRYDPPWVPLDTKNPLKKTPPAKTARTRHNQAAASRIHVETELPACDKSTSATNNNSTSPKKIRKSTPQSIATRSAANPPVPNIP